MYSGACQQVSCIYIKIYFFFSYTRRKIHNRQERLFLRHKRDDSLHYQCYKIDNLGHIYKEHNTFYLNQLFFVNLDNFHEIPLVCLQLNPLPHTLKMSNPSSKICYMSNVNNSPAFWLSDNTTHRNHQELGVGEGKERGRER